MDAIKILGTLISNDALKSPAGRSIAGSLLSGAVGGGRGGAAGDILATLLGGRRGRGQGGLGALGAVLSAAAMAQANGKGSGGNSGGAMDVIGSLLGGAAAPQQPAQPRAGGAVGSLLGSLLGGGGPPQQAAPPQGAPQQAAGGGGLGGLVGSLLGGRQQASSPAPGQAPAAGGVGALLGSLVSGARTAKGGGGGNPLASLLGAATQQKASGSELLGLVLGGGEPAPCPKEAQREAELLLTAMCLAAKADGHIDAREREAILGRAGDLDPDEIAFLEAQLDGDVDLDAFVASVPAGMEEQIYAFSLMGIHLDTAEEKDYFQRLAAGLKLPPEECNRIHEQMGQPLVF